ncbi:peptidase M50 [Litorihabitans aurantiacus]|uniref:Peptidase M50 n=1 Tax=Litorihabitans aurantiacus TaxID=1930061 RepID=A0AA37UVI3_9MICO|nr:peptidase M50 [Litorihabitans aurantiacus]
MGGSPVYLAPSWLLVAAVLTVIFLPTVRRVAPDLGFAAAVGASATFPVLLFASVLAHELAHGAAARAIGARVREYVLTFWGGHTSFDAELRTPGASAFVSAAGPAANLLLAGLGWLALQAIPLGLVAVVVASLTWANVVVAAFNLLPGNPLDGGRILEALLWRVTGDRDRATIGAGWVGRAIAVVIALVVLLPPLLRGERPVLTTAVWGLLVAGLVWSGASRSIAVGRARRSAAGFDLRPMLRAAVALDAATPIEALPDVLRAAAVPDGAAPPDVVLLDPAGAPVALLDPEAVRGVPPHLRAGTPVGAAARGLPPEAVLTAVTGADALAALARGIEAGGVVVVLVAPGVVATTTRAAVLAALAPGGR